ncbi:cell division protein FtsQ/DivIB [Roseateles chitosanitabidus]|jgi:cell division protein FtsQ|uniref:cell division protein FtsQ/DivIB n=1 Tax=Roseateles chitosanitabidus TaxID=65048 RepID=UPI00082BB3F8|nr:cell division protein FtsQ/DivIB [Roseateles chitosanitabidus]MBO9689607.1 cell division protein FtsQ/DivIB [Roseateles chitosanitabidus]
MGATFTHTAAPLPPDIRVMNGVAGLLLAGVALAALAAGALWLARQPALAIRAITVEGDVSRNSSASLRANALPRLSGSFVTMNLQKAKAAFEAVPWVRHATVRRVWPLQLVVTLEEHQPAAYWETKAENADADSDAVVDSRLVNTFGEVFEANLGDVEDEDLPTLAGPDKSSAAMLAMWRQLDPMTHRKLDEGVSRLDLSGRGSWKATLEKGAVVELGRGSEAEVVARYGQFIANITQITTRYQTSLVSADLRHENGYAVRLAGVTTVSNAPKGATKKN